MRARAGRRALGKSLGIDRGDHRDAQAVAAGTAEPVRAVKRAGERSVRGSTVQRSDRVDHFVIVASKAKDREERRILIMPTLSAILDRRRKGPDSSDLPVTAYVLGNETGEVMSRRKVCGLWLTTCEREGERPALHDLRAEAGSQLLEAGVPIHDVRDVLGHSSTTMTSTYLRTRTTSLIKAFERRSAHRARQGIRRVV